MRIWQFISLFICSLATWFVGSSIIPLLPLYAAELGASPTMTGNYLAFSFTVLALGTFVAGYLSRRFQRQRMFIILAGVIALPATWLMGYAENVWQLAALTAVNWFFGGGIALSLLSILTGLLASGTQRGRIFGAMMATSSLAGLIGGLVVGPMADQWGYPRMFAVVSLVWGLQAISGFFLPRVDTAVVPEPSVPGTPLKLHDQRPFWVFLAANLLVSVAVSIGLMGGSMAMASQGITPTAITLLAAFQSGMGLVMNPLAGRLSDSLDRQTVLIIAYIGRFLGMFVLALATSLGHFWLMGVFFIISMTKDGVGQALVTDLAPAGRLEHSLSWFNAGRWIGNVVGFIITGYTMQLLGQGGTFMLAAALPLAAIGMLRFAGGMGQKRPLPVSV